jgi:hypothetical protein
MQVTQILGSQRSLVDYLTMIEGPDKPFLAMAPKGPKVNNLLYEWPADAFEDAEDNAQIDGTDVMGFSNADADYAVLSNRLQWIRDSAMVTKLAQEIQNQAGVPNKKALAIRKKLERLWRNIEAMLCSDNDVQTGTGAKPNKCRGIGKWITASLSEAGAFSAQTAAILTGATASMTEAQVQTLLQSLWTSSGKIKTYQALVGGNVKRQFTDFTNTQKGTANVLGSIRTYAQENKRAIVNSIDSFTGDFGTLELVPSQWLTKFTAYGNYRGYIMDMNRVDVVWMQGPKVQELEDQGGGPRFMVDAIVGLRVYMPKELGAMKFTS